MTMAPVLVTPRPPRATTCTTRGYPCLTLSTSACSALSVSTEPRSSHPQTDHTPSSSSPPGCLSTPTAPTAVKSTVTCVWSPSSRLSALSRLRRWLGPDALPPARSGHPYRLHVVTDWALAAAPILDSRGQLRAGVPTDALLTALRLVQRGTPR